MKYLEVGEVPSEIGCVPPTMKAWVIRAERHGQPQTAMKVEDVPVPELGPNEVLVMVMAAGINYNGIWASLGVPISPMRYTGYDFHITGSDASGIVWKVGEGVKRWKVGQEVVINGTQTCGECSACNGLDPMGCEQQKIWGYETNWGAFAQFTKVQASQLLAKPKHLTWEEAASYGASCFTAYRMLVSKGRMQAGENVLVWGGAGGLGTMAIQLCKVYGANAIATVSSARKAQFCMQLGAKGVINRLEFQCWGSNTSQTPAEQNHRLAEMKRFGSAIRQITGGKDPDIVFEHVGQDTFATSLFVANKFGRIITCGATTGFQLTLDARYLWMRQKTIYGSHNANLDEGERANQLVMARKIAPVLGEVFPFDQLTHAYQQMVENVHLGKMVVLVQAAQPGLGRSEA
jgi:crotonyl-CoA carboxylase/reductase